MTVADSAALAQAFNALGQDLHPRLVDADGNAVLSPASLGLALAMTLDGARTATRAQMEAVLRLDGGVRERAAIALAARLSRWAPGTGEPGGVRLALATALFLTRSGAIVDEARRARLREAWAAEIVAGADLDAVNAWADRHTGGLIPSILTSLDPLAVCVILAAIHLEADWQHPFRADETADAPFTLASGDSVKVPTMSRTGAWATLAQPGFRAIRIPYADPDLAMIVVLPDAPSGFSRLARTPGNTARLDGLREHLDTDALARFLDGLDGLEPRMLRLALPRFALATRADLVDALRACGLTLPFSPEADLSGMTGEHRLDPPLLVGQIVHKAVIEVAEKGTRAAAVTAVMVAGSAATAPQPETFAVDRPFLYFVVDRATGAVLFRGQVGDPRGGGDRRPRETYP